VNEFIQMVTSKLGTSESTARSATGGMLQMLQGQLDGGDFSQLMEKLPGASDLLGESESSGGGSGMLGSLMNQATSALGGNLGGAVGLLGKLKDTGLDTDQLASFASMFLGFVKDKAGAGLVDRILGKIPELKSLAG
jgi:tape measure domain-containing protein